MILLNNQSSKRGLNTSNTNIRLSDVFCWEDRHSIYIYGEQELEPNTQRFIKLIKLE